ncbi:MAG: DUF58 domain-containing protein [Flavobacterium sp. BFFFF2]|nr:MAG: DUF58 domain-containing protein [Flavobacterium sp. BFFFF2]
MVLEQHNATLYGFKHLEVLAHQIVEGFISGMHKSPFHGFSAEFAEHKLYNAGESTKHIDWKLFAKSDRLYTKRYEEDTNLRCHLIIDQSASMHYPQLTTGEPFYRSKIGFSVMASAILMNLLKKQRDAVGLSIYSDKYDFYAPEKGSDRHHRMLLNQLEGMLEAPKVARSTDSITYLHQIAEKMHRRSLIFLFTDLFQEGDSAKLFQALQHLKHNKHRVVLFHVLHKETESELQLDSKPRKFIDVETGETLQLFAENVQENYKKAVSAHLKDIENACTQYRISYVPVAVENNFDQIMTTYLVERQKFA